MTICDTKMKREQSGVHKMAVTINDFGLTFWYHIYQACLFTTPYGWHDVVQLPWIDNLQSCVLI